MKYDRKYAGKWVAVQDDTIIASGRDFTGLHTKISARRDMASVRFSLLPKGNIALRQHERTLYCTHMNKFMTATEARKKWYAIIEEAKHPGAAVIITHEGIPKVVVMSFEEYEGWMETMDIMADPELDKELREAMKEMKAGNLHKDTVSLDEARKRLKL